MNDPSMEMLITSSHTHNCPNISTSITTEQTPFTAEGHEIQLNDLEKATCMHDFILFFSNYTSCLHHSRHNGSCGARTHNIIIQIALRKQ